MTSDFLQIPLNAYQDSAITAARLYWVEDILPDPKGCLDPFERLAHFQMQAGAIQLLDSLNKYFEVLGVESQNVQVATSGIIEADSRNFSKFLTESNRRSGMKDQREIETIEGAGLWSKWKLAEKWEEQQKQCRPLIAKTREHIETVQEQWKYIVQKARCVASNHENKGAGIGVAIDTSTAPENHITVTNLVAEGPAHNAGLQIGDQIIAVDGKSLDYLMHQEGSFTVAGLYTCLHCGWYVTHAMAGPIGSAVTLEVFRDGRKKEIKIPRQFELSALRFAGLVP